MKYPKTPKEAEKALETYKLSLSEDNPLMTVNLVSEITTDMVEACLMDVMLLEGTPCEKPILCVKSMYFDLCNPQKELEINSTYVDVKDFVAAADTISQYLCSRREIDEIL